MSSKCFVFLFVFAAAWSQEPNYSVLSVAKSGTNLLAKCLHLISKRDPNFVIVKMVKGYTHPYFTTQDNPRYLMKREKLVVLIRDPRDICVSAALHYTKLLANQKSGFSTQVESLSSIRVDGADLIDYKARWLALTLQQKLNVIIHTAFPQPFTNFFYDVKMMSSMLDLLRSRGVDMYLCRFENLIGPKGGGSAQACRMEIKGLANYLGASLNEDDVTYVAENLFGETWTFRRGQIGEWREVFTPELEKGFNRRFKAVLKQWGYK